MIYPPGYDATKAYQEIDYQGHRIVVFKGGVEDALAPLIASFGEDVYRVLRSTPCMTESDWLNNSATRSPE